MIYKFFIRTLINLTLINFLLSQLEKIDSIILEFSYRNIAEDLISISFPGSVNYNYLIFSLPIAIILSFLIDRFVKLNFKDDTLETYSYKFFILFMINVSVVSSGIFFLRLYEVLSRFFVLLFFVIYPFVLLLIEYFLYKIFDKFENPIKTLVFSILGILFIFTNFVYYQNSQDNVLNENRIIEDEIVDAATIIFQDTVSEEFVLEGEECNEWKGTGIYSGCINPKSIEINKFEIQVTNIISHESELYFILKDGLIYKQSNEDGILELFLDISNRVHTEFPGISQGLYSLAFKPSNESFLVTYSNDDIALVIEKFYLNKNKEPIYENSEILLKVSNNVKFHFGGSLAWSDYFDGFLVGIGDMRENIMPLVHSDAINTQSYKGKIILLESDKKLQAPLINEHGQFESFDNIVAFGLRNPWQLMEYSDKLFVTDVGSQFIEELHTIDYKTRYGDGILKSSSFGWPVLMGDALSYSYEERNKEALTRLDGKITDLYYWKGNAGIKADDFIIENSLPPLLQYDHVVNPDVIRAAIIGGDIIKDPISKYNNFYFFTDYVESELYGLNINTSELFIFPLPSISNATSLRVSPFETDTILIAYINNSVMEVKLP